MSGGEWIDRFSRHWSNTPDSKNQQKTREQARTEPNNLFFLADWHVFFFPASLRLSIWPRRPNLLSWWWEYLRSSFFLVSSAVHLLEKNGMGLSAGRECLVYIYTYSLLSVCLLKLLLFLLSRFVLSSPNIVRLGQIRSQLQTKKKERKEKKMSK